MQTEGGEEHTAAKLLAALVCTLIGATGVALLLIVACTHSQPQKVNISASSGKRVFPTCVIGQVSHDDV